MKHVSQQFDIIIIGGGLVGVSLAIALADSGYRLALIEAQAMGQLSDPGFDARSIALSLSSSRILQSIDTWQLLTKVTPIDKIHISQQNRFGATRLHQPETILGHVAEIHHINNALQKKIEKKIKDTHLKIYNPASVIDIHSQGSVTIMHNQQQLHLSAEIIVAADGAQSTCRKLLNGKVKQHDYHQHAIVANIGLKRSHNNTAYERFTQQGPIAMLPITNQRSALVWVNAKEQTEQLITLNDNDFLTQLHYHFGYRLGRLNQCGRRTSFPLKSAHMPEQVINRVVFIGNAAHSLHPIAGQGFNLGLRDVAMLAQLIHQQGLTNTMLQHYQKTRIQDQANTMRFTDQLVSVFTSYDPFIKAGRGAALIALDTMPTLKHHLSRFATGLTGRVPDLACGIPLGEQHD